MTANTRLWGTDGFLRKSTKGGTLPRVWLVVSLTSLALPFWQGCVSGRNHQRVVSFYESIQRNDVEGCQRLLAIDPTLVTSKSLYVRIPGPLTVVTRDESPLGVAIMFESRQVFDALLVAGTDVNKHARNAEP